MVGPLLLGVLAGIGALTIMFWVLNVSDAAFRGLPFKIELLEDRITRLEAKR
jgi:hypothetical protein